MLLPGQRQMLKEGCGHVNEELELVWSLLAYQAEQQLHGVWQLHHQREVEWGEQGHGGTGGVQAHHEAVMREPACEHDKQLDASWDAVAALCSSLWLFVAFCGALQHHQGLHCLLPLFAPNLSQMHKLCRHPSQQLARPLAGNHIECAVLRLPGLLQTQHCFGCDGCLRCWAPSHAHAHLSQLQIFGPYQHHTQALYDRSLPAMSRYPSELASAAAREHGPQTVEV